MFRATSNRVLLAGVLLVAVASGVCVAVTVNINPHKIVLNAEGKADDIQANIPMVLASARIVDFDVTLSFDGTEVAKAESARYCVIDDILIIGFDRTDLQNNPDVQDMANSTVTAEVDGYVTVENSVGDETTRYFSGTDMVEIVKPGKKGQ
jgi:hypothetical protein